MHLLLKGNLYKALIYSLLLIFMLLSPNICVTNGTLGDWIVINGHWEIKDDTLIGDIDRGKALIYSKASLWDIDLECQVIPASERSGIIFNMQNILNHYELVLERQQILLILRTTDSTKYIASKRISKNKGYRFRIIQEENSVKVLIDEEIIFVVNNITFTSGYIGFSVQNGKAYFSSIKMKGREPIEMKKNLLKVSINEKTGVISSLIGTLDNSSVQFCDNTQLEADNSWGWGTVILDYGDGLITTNKMKCKIYTNKDETKVEYSEDKVKVTIKRVLFDSF